MLALFLASCGARSELGLAGARDDAGSLADVTSAAPPLTDVFLGREGNRCIGFGLGEPVVGHPPPSLPLLCGLDCSSGEPCPAGAQCYTVYEPERSGIRWVVSDRIAGYQCAPIDRACAAYEVSEPYCKWCDRDEECR